MKCLRLLHNTAKVPCQDNKSPRPLKKVRVPGQVLGEGRRLHLLARLPFAVHWPGVHYCMQKGKAAISGAERHWHMLPFTRCLWQTRIITFSTPVKSPSFPFPPPPPPRTPFFPPRRAQKQTLTVFTVNRGRNGSYVQERIQRRWWSRPPSQPLNRYGYVIKPSDIRRTLTTSAIHSKPPATKESLQAPSVTVPKVCRRQ